jgi:hypothetical protein
MHGLFLPLAGAIQPSDGSAAPGPLYRPLLLAIQARFLGGRTGWPPVLPCLTPPRDVTGQTAARRTGGVTAACRPSAGLLLPATARSLECAERAGTLSVASPTGGLGRIFAGVPLPARRPKRERSSIRCWRKPDRRRSLQAFCPPWAYGRIYTGCQATPAQQMLALVPPQAGFGMAGPITPGRLAYETNRLPEACSTSTASSPCTWRRAYTP